MQTAACDFATSVAALSPDDAAAVGADPGGARVLEALLASPAANAATKIRLLEALQGSWAAVALKPAGSYFVEAAYTWAVSRGGCGDCLDAHV